MKINPTDPYMEAALRQADTLREHDKYASIVREANKVNELQKIVEDADRMKTALGLNSPLAEYRREEELRRSITDPHGLNQTGITGMVQESLAQAELKHGYLYPEPQNNMPEIPIFRPPPDIMHKTNKMLEKQEQHQAEVSSHLKEIASQSQGTSKQNEKMIFWAKVAAIATIAGLLVTIGFQLGQNSSSTSAPVSVPVVKSAPAPVVLPAPAVNTKK